MEHIFWVTSVPFHPKKTHHDHMTPLISRLRHSPSIRSSFRRSWQALMGSWVKSCTNPLLGITCTFSLLVPLQPCVSEDAGADARQLAKTLSAATLRIETPTDVCSGVIVSSSGLILSVAHGPDRDRVLARWTILQGHRAGPQRRSGRRDAANNRCFGKPSASSDFAASRSFNVFRPPRKTSRVCLRISRPRNQRTVSSIPDGQN